MSDFDPKDVIADHTKSSTGGDFDPKDVVADHTEAHASDSSPEESSLLNTLITKLGQGISLNTAPRLGGVLSGAGRVFGVDNLGGKIKDVQINPDGPTLDPDQLLAAYRKTRDSLTGMQDKMQEERPLTSTAAMMAGGLSAAPLLPAAFMAPAGELSAASPLAVNMLKGAANAIPTGAVAGAGNARTDDLADLGENAYAGAKTAALIGGSIPAVSAAGRGVINSNPVQSLLTKYRLGKQGLDLNSPDTLIQQRDAMKGVAGDVDDTLRSKLQSIFAKKRAVLSELEKSGKTVNVKDVLQGLADDVGSVPMTPDEEAMVQKFLQNQMSRQGHDLTPMETDNLLRQVQALKGNAKAGGTTFSAADSAANKLKALQDSLDPRLQQANQEAFQLGDASEALTGRNLFQYQNAPKDLKMQNSMADSFEQLGGNPKVDSNVNQIMKGGLETSKNKAVAPLGEIVPEVNPLIEKARQIANITRQAKQTQAETGNTGLKGLWDMGLSAPSKVANKIGLSVKDTQNFVQNGVKTLTTAEPGTLKALSNSLTSLGGDAASFGKVLSEVATKSPQSKNAVIFSLMQNPLFRSALHDVHGNEMNASDVNTSSPESISNDFPNLEKDEEN